MGAAKAVIGVAGSAVIGIIGSWGIIRVSIYILNSFIAVG